ncbi:MAG: PIN domain-containing protein [Microgenomates group bacterium]
MKFVDTNYFVRIIENDNEAQVEEIKKLFLRGAEGLEDLISSTVVLFEIYWLMKSFYGKEKEGLTRVLRDVLAMSFIKWESQKILMDAVFLMKKTNYDLEDAYNLVYAKNSGSEKLASFDMKLQRIWKKY